MCQPSCANATRPLSPYSIVYSAHANKAIAEMLSDFDLGHKSAVCPITMVRPWANHFPSLQEELRELFAEVLPNLVCAGQKGATR